MAFSIVVVSVSVFHDCSSTFVLTDWADVAVLAFSGILLLADWWKRGGETSDVNALLDLDLIDGMCDKDTKRTQATIEQNTSNFSLHPLVIFKNNMTNQQTGLKRPRDSPLVTPPPSTGPPGFNLGEPAFLDWAKSLVDDDYDSEDEDDYGSDAESCDLSPEERERESRAVKALVKAAFDRTIAEPYLTQLIGPEKPSKRIRHQSPEQVETVTENEVKGIKPFDFLQAMLVSKGEQCHTFSAQSLQTFFHQVTPEFIQAYDMVMMKAIREDDVDMLRKRMETGGVLRCGNRFGESAIHACCRKGSVRVLRFLLEEAKVSSKVCCDSGRTPLHDACWSTKPNFEIVKLLLDDCPDLLYITDKRGCTPLAYTQGFQSSDWCDFLSRLGVERLIPRILV